MLMFLKVQKYSKTENNCFIFELFKIVLYFCDGEAEFTASPPVFSITWSSRKDFDAQETFISLENGCAAYYCYGNSDLFSGIQCKKKNNN